MVLEFLQCRHLYKAFILRLFSNFSQFPKLIKMLFYVIITVQSTKFIKVVNTSSLRYFWSKIL